MLIVILSTIFFLVDQVSKLLVIRFLNEGNVISVIDDFFYILPTNNTGAAFSILVGQRIFLIGVTAIIIGFLLYYVIRNRNSIVSKIDIIIFSLIIGGSFGNLFDRIFRGYVVDFLSVRIGDYSFPIFNVADSFIVIGVVLLVLVGGRKK